MADPDAAPRYHRWLLLAPRTVLTAARMAACPPVLGALLALTGVILWSAGEGRREPRPRRRTISYVLSGYVLLNTIGVALLKAVFMRDMWVEAMPGRVVNILVLQLLVSTTALALWARSWLPAGPARLYNRRTGLLSVLVVGLLVTGQSRRAWQDLLLSAADYSQRRRATATLMLHIGVGCPKWRWNPCGSLPPLVCLRPFPRPASAPTSTLS